MRIQEIKVYEYAELSDKAKEKALYNLVDSYWSNGDAYENIKDCCFLFDIPEKDKTIKINNLDNILLGNNRGDLFYTTEGNFYLNCTKSMVVNDYDAFYQWLQLDKKLIDKINNDDYELYIAGEPENRRCVTTYLQFDNNMVYKPTTKNEDKQIEKAKSIFDNHIYNIWLQIKEQWEYMQTIEYFIESNIIDEHEFLENGEIY